MFCPSCGTKNSSNSIACSNCGALLPGLTGNISLPEGVASAAAPAAPRAPVEEPDYFGGSLSRSGDSGGYTIAESDPAVVNRVGVSASANAPREGAAPFPDGRLIGRLKLVVEQGKILGEQFLLSDARVMIGRYDAATGQCPDIDLTAQDPSYVHRHHAQITFGADGRSLTVEDMGGRNGTYLNNQLLARNTSAPLQLGDKVRIGRVVMRLQVAPEMDDDGPRKR